MAFLAGPKNLARRAVQRLSGQVKQLLFLCAGHTDCLNIRRGRRPRRFCSFPIPPSPPLFYLLFPPSPPPPPLFLLFLAPLAAASFLPPCPPQNPTSATTSLPPVRCPLPCPPPTSASALLFHIAKKQVDEFCHRALVSASRGGRRSVKINIDDNLAHMSMHLSRIINSPRDVTIHIRQATQHPGNIFRTKRCVPSKVNLLGNDEEQL